MKRMLCLWIGLLLLTACGGKRQKMFPDTSVLTGISTETAASDREGDAERGIRIQDTEGHTVVFRLDDSPAAQALYEQLPLTVPIENYRDNEKIFYPPEKLETSDTKLSDGGEGTLAYYAPWGNVVLFFGKALPSGDLYALGSVLSGREHVQALSGEIRVDAVD